MKTISIHHPSESDGALVFIDSLINILLGAGVGVIEAELKNRDSECIDWIFTSRLTGHQQVVLTSPWQSFRPSLAQIGFRILDDPYRGHAIFNVKYAGDPQPLAERFSLFLCNEMETAVWIKLYLYGIDRVWPFPDSP